MASAARRHFAPYLTPPVAPGESDDGARLGFSRRPNESGPPMRQGRRLSFSGRFVCVRRAGPKVISRAKTLASPLGHACRRQAACLPLAGAGQTPDTGSAPALNQPGVPANQSSSETTRRLAGYWMTQSAVSGEQSGCASCWLSGRPRSPLTTQLAASPTPQDCAGEPPNEQIISTLYYFKPTPLQIIISRRMKLLNSLFWPGKANANGTTSKGRPIKIKRIRHLARPHEPGPFLEDILARCAQITRAICVCLAASQA